MACVTNRLLRSEHTSARLRTMLATCGTQIATGRRVWCGSPACDRCRRFRVRRVAEGIGAWIDSCLTAHRIRIVEAVTRPFTGPAEALDEVHSIRRAMTRACTYRTQIDERWGEVWSYGAWLPDWDGTAWIARLSGVVFLGGVNEITYADVHGVRLTSFGRCLLGADVREYIVRAIGSVSGVKGCGAAELSSVFNEIARRGGFRALMARRGLQQGAE